MKNRRVDSKLAQGFYRFVVLFALISLVHGPQAAFGAAVEELEQSIKSRGTSFYRDFFDSVIYGPVSGVLRLDRIRDRVTFRKHEALDINAFDEVPDSSFFVNRHGRNRMSLQDLKRGPAKDQGLNPNGTWRVMKGKVEGVSAGLFIEDQAGVPYLLKFDPKDNSEMATSAEIISHKFFHAIGYHVPEYYLATFDPSILTPDANAAYYNENGFKKPLTQEALAELVDRIPKLKGGLVRTSASKLLTNSKGYMDFEGRRSSDPDDLIPHEDRRSIRALRVFGSWLNHYDLRKGNALDVIETENGRAFVKHYLIDFGSTLGSAGSHPKVPVAGYEHIVDWFAIGKSAPVLKLQEEPWEKKWDAFNRQIAYPELGYFDNQRFDPGAWKTQLSYEAFHRLTAADAFWAAKIILAFSDEEIKSVVETGEFSNPRSADLLSEILIARRDLIARCWFDRVTPLDHVRLTQTGNGAYGIQFTDLAVQHGFSTAEETRYYDQVLARNPGGNDQVIGGQEFQTPSLALTAPEVNESQIVTVFLYVRRGSDGGWSKPPLKVTLARPAPPGGSLRIVEIDHGL